MPDEILDVVNEHDEVVGSVSRREMFDQHLSTGTGPLCRLVHVFLADANGNLYIAQRHENKSFAPNLLEAAAAGYLAQGESYAVAAARELKEELGLDIPLTKIGKCQLNWGFCAVYLGQFDGEIADLALDHTEVAAIYQIHSDTVYNMLTETPTLFLPTFHQTFMVYWRHRWPLLDVVDADDNVVGQASFEEIYRDKLSVRVVYVLVVNARGNILVQHRSDTVKIAPGRLDVSAAGHVDGGEDYAAAAARELKEELGVDATLAAPIAYQRRADNKFYQLFVVRYDGDVTIDPAEVQDALWLSCAQIQDIIATVPGVTTSALRDSLAHYQRLQQK